LERELAAHPVKLELPKEPVLARFDFYLVQHALANLLVNAAIHTPPGTAIEVRAETTDECLLVTVADRGPGIPKEILPRIFEKFVRAPNAPTGGSGLGLTIAKGFIEAQGGTIAAANRPGGGAQFTLRLPRIEKPSESQPIDEHRKE
jgi:two-component system sensor histidine kinase KdpD